ncbi:MAG: PAS domain-containing protein [Blastochloris sp.]|nr:PAS domain-containing protein [Blastochloris sp.]
MASESERYLRAVLNNAPIIIFTLNRAGVLTHVDGQGMQTLPFDADKLIGCRAIDVVRDEPHLLDNIRRAMTGETFTKRVSASERVFECWYAPMREPSGSIAGVIGVATDITERAHAEHVLSRMRLRLLEQREAERLHIARELHDSAVQYLIGISYQLAAVVQRIQTDVRCNEPTNDAVAPALHAVRSGVLEVAAQLRDLIGALRHNELDELGLAAALQRDVTRLTRWSDSRSPAILLDVDQPETALPRPVALTLFRTAQEALRNAIRHAKAQRITLRLRLRGNEAALSVRDDGRGFQAPARLSKLARTNHFGLVGIAERIAWAGGRLAIQSQPGVGTEVSICIPLNRQGVTHDGDNSGRNR